MKIQDFPFKYFLIWEIFENFNGVGSVSCVLIWWIEYFDNFDQTFEDCTTMNVEQTKFESNPMAIVMKI